MASEVDIAIVGVGCCFPGAENLEEFWKVLSNGECHVTDIPKSRWNNEAFYDADKDAPGKSYVLKAGLLKNHDEWDNRFFGISDVEAARIDPQQRYVLECVHMALEDGGLTKTAINGSNTGVYIGCMNDDYKMMTTEDETDQTSYSATGMTTSIIAARVAYVYNLHGPCLTLDTACSSSLVAIHLGCQAIRSGDAQLTICGGVSSIISPKTFIALSKARMMSTVGQCQSFTDTADGYARGEGCGIVVLKKFDEAIRDKNKIWGIVRTGCNQDGRMAQPITAPSGDQQRKLLHHVYSKYGMDPASVQYIEAHGTGTPIGDPTEVNALGDFFGKHTRLNTNNTKTKPILLGSVKSNIGHTESAAGIAGLIKVLLMMQKGQMVASLHIKKDKSNINKKLQLESHGLDIVLDSSKWDANTSGQRIACVNSFGFGGSNSHAIVISDSSDNRGNVDCGLKTEYTFPKLFCITAIDRLSLDRNILGFVNDITETKESLKSVSLTSMTYREHMSCRVLLYGHDTESITKRAALVKREPAYSIQNNHRNSIAFVFCGVGTTWTGMCRQMMSIHQFKDKVEEIDVLLRPLTGWGVSEMFKTNTSYDDPFVNHIAIFATQMALAAVWKSWGIRPDVIIGQSVGEVAASCVSGIIPLHEAVRIIFHRSKILAKQTGGAMMVVGNRDVNETEELCQNFRNITVAVYSSPVACTLSGNKEELQDLKENLQAEISNESTSYLIRELKVNCAYHSPLIQGCKVDIINDIGKVQSGKHFNTPIISTVYGEFATEDHFTTAEYWADNVCKPVLFYQSIAKAAKTNPCVFLEIGPRPVLKAHIQNIVPSEQATCLSSMTVNNEFEALCSSLNVLFQMGKQIDWNAVHGIINPSPSVLPRYRFNKVKNIHIGERMKSILSGKISQVQASHMFVRQSSTGNEHHFDIAVSKNDTPFVYDHTLSDTTLVPGATYVEAAVHIGSVLLNRHVLDLSVKVDFQRPVTPSNDEAILLPFTIQKSKDRIEFVCKNSGRAVATGSVFISKSSPPPIFDIHTIKGRCPMRKNKMGNYKCLEKLQFRYGPSLSLMEKSWASEHECLVELVIPESVECQLHRTACHPAVIDGVFQAFGILSHTSAAIPKGVSRVVIHGSPKQKMYVYASLSKTTLNGSSYNAVLLTQLGQVIVEVNDFHTRALDNTTSMPSNLKLGVTHVHLNVSNKTEKKKDVLVLNVNNAQHRLYELIRDERCFTIGSSVDDLHNRSFDSILYIGTATNQKTIETASSAIAQYNALKATVLKLAEFQIACPLYVLTENCQLCPGRNMLHVEGSVNWGLVRALRHESLLPDIRIIDVDSDCLSKETLVDIVVGLDMQHAEICITSTGTYLSKLRSLPTSQKQTRQITVDESTKAMLYSRRWDKISMPYYKEVMQFPTLLTGIQIDITEFCLHDSRIYAPTIKLSDWPLNSFEDSGCPVVAIEGKGTHFANCEGKENVFFCHPVIATKPFVSIPKECIIPVKCIPTYSQGMLSMLCILYKLSIAVPMNSKVLVIKHENEMEWSREFLFQILQERNCDTTLACVSDIETTGSAMYRCDVVVIATYFTDDILRRVVHMTKDGSKLVTVSYLLNNDMRSKLHIGALDLVEIDTRDVFRSNALQDIIPKVERILTRSLHFGLFKQSGSVLHCNIPFRTHSLSFEKEREVQVGSTGLFQQNSCYIVVGGLTGLGRLLVEYIAELGGGHVVSFSRRSPSTKQLNEFRSIEDEYGCKIYFKQVDVSDLQSVRKGFTDLQEQIEHVSIRGIFHGAGILCDGLIVNQTEEQVKQVFDPKVMGSWNLHMASKQLRLDYFVLQSSVVSILGNSGQTNYSAANSFLDSLAAYRRSLGLCGQSINWGALSLGMAIENGDREKFLKKNGILLMSTKEIKQCFVDALISNDVHTCFAAINWDVYARNAIQTAHSKKFQELVSNQEETSNHDSDNAVIKLTDLSSLNNTERKNKVVEFVREQVCKAFVVTSEDLKNDIPFVSLGVDSMSAMSFVNSVYQILKVKIPIVKILSEQSNVMTIAEYLLQDLGNSGWSNVKNSLQYSNGNMTFMQESVLAEYLEDDRKPDLIHLVELEIQGMTLTFDEWKNVFKNIIQKHHQLSLRLIDDTDNEFQLGTFNDTELHNEITEVPLSQMIQERRSGIDLRKTMIFDLRNERPIKCHVGFGSDVTALRISIHKIVSDLFSLSILFRELGQTIKALVTGSMIPKTELQKVEMSDLIRLSLGSSWEEAEHFWRVTIRPLTQPVTMGSPMQKPNSEFCLVASHRFEPSFVYELSNFLRQNNVTIFQLMVTLYQLLLHIETSQDSVVVTTAVDMRVYVPGLSGILGRCVNVIPLVSNVIEKGSLKDFLLQNVSKLTRAVEFGWYPTKLIYSNFESSTMRESVGRHYLVINKMDMLNSLTEDNGLYSVNVTNVSTRRFEKETALYVDYDLDGKELVLDMNYNSVICGADMGNRFMSMLVTLLNAMMTNGNQNLGSLIKRETEIKNDALTKPNVLVSPKSTPKQSRGRSKTAVDPINHFITDTENITNGQRSNKKLQFARRGTPIHSIPLQSLERATVLLKGKFQKQTTKGWYHTVHVHLEKTVSDTANLPSLILRWGNRDKKPTKAVNLLEIPNVQLRKVDGAHSIILSATKRQYVFSTYDVDQAKQLMQTIQDFLDKYINIRL